LGWSVPTDHPNLTDFSPPSAAGNIPASLGNLQNLEYLKLQGNQLTGVFLGWSVPTDHLNLTDFSPPSAAGNIPTSLGNLQNLLYLLLQGNQLTGMFLGWSVPTDHVSTIFTLIYQRHPDSDMCKCPPPRIFSLHSSQVHKQQWLPWRNAYQNATSESEHNMPNSFLLLFLLSHAFVPVVPCVLVPVGHVL
jgi:hypothetical protein